MIHSHISRLIIAVSAIATMVFTTGCGKEKGGTSIGGSSTKIWPRDGLFLTKGAVDTVDFTYDLLKDKPMDFSIASLKQRPVHVVYYVPKGFDAKHIPILFSMTGAERVLFSALFDVFIGNRPYSAMRG